jgi:hypothetical protein
MPFFVSPNRRTNNRLHEMRSRVSLCLFDGAIRFRTARSAPPECRGRSQQPRLTDFLGWRPIALRIRGIRGIRVIRAREISPCLLGSTTWHWRASCTMLGVGRSDGGGKNDGGKIAGHRPKKGLLNLPGPAPAKAPHRQRPPACAQPLSDRTERGRLRSFAES